MPPSPSEDRATLSVPIILLGSTGSGKSSFVNAVVGEQVAAVGVGIQPATDAITQYTFALLERGRIDLQCVLVDTPGFCHNLQHRWKGTTDLLILQEVEKFLHEQFKEEMEASQFGVIFLFNNSAPEVDWEQEQRTSAVFTRLVGGYSLRYLTVVTTSRHGGSTRVVETGLFKALGDRGIQPICCNCFGDAHVAHPHCGDVRTPRQIVEHVVSLALSSKAEGEEEWYSDHLSDEESDHDSNSGDGREYGLDGGAAFLPPDSNPAPITVIQIAHGTFNDVGGNQTNIYGSPETSSQARVQSTHPSVNDQHQTVQQDPDNTVRTLQRDPDAPQGGSPQPPDGLNRQPVSQEASAGVGETMQAVLGDGLENLDAENHDPPEYSQPNPNEQREEAHDRITGSGSRPTSEQGLPTHDKVVKTKSSRCTSDCCVVM